MFNTGFNAYPYVAKEGLLSALKTKFNWGAILTNTQKTLNIVNQAIPLVYQVKPIVNNAKTIFKIMGAVKDDGVSTLQQPSYKNNYTTKNNTINNTIPDNAMQNVNTTPPNKPIFFL